MSNTKPLVSRWPIFEWQNENSGDGVAAQLVKVNRQQPRQEELLIISFAHDPAIRYRRRRSLLQYDLPREKLD